MSMSSKYIGKTFGQLLVTSSHTAYTSGGYRKQVFNVRCSCGRAYEITAKLVQSRGTKMCRTCAEKIYSVPKPKIPSMYIPQERKYDTSHHPLYTTWRTMIRRCLQPTHHKYPTYGGRGITVCDAWKGSRLSGELSTNDGFIQFCADMGDRPPGKTLDRRDNNAGYSPENCRWSTISQQQNNRRTNVLVTVDGETHTVTEWGRLFGAHEDWYVYARERGIPLERAARKLLYGGRIGRSKFFGSTPRTLSDEDE